MICTCEWERCLDEWDFRLPLDELLMLLMLQTLDFLEPREPGEPGGVWNLHFALLINKVQNTAEMYTKILIN